MTTVFSFHQSFRASGQANRTTALHALPKFRVSDSPLGGFNSTMVAPLFRLDPAVSKFLLSARARRGTLASPPELLPMCPEFA